jgi:sugar phosphate permease
MVPSAVSAEQAIFSKIRLRLIPFMFLLYVVAYLDRVNVGFAILQMDRDLGSGRRSSAAAPASSSWVIPYLKSRATC